VISQITYQQRCLFQIIAGVEEEVVTCQHTSPPERHNHRRRRQKPLGSTARPILYWWIDIDLDQEQDEDSASPGADKVRRSLHPGKATRVERASWVELPKGWDSDRARTRGDCAGDRECPWCHSQVAMRATTTHTTEGEVARISCPECRGIVGYRPSKGGDWSWCRLDLGIGNRSAIYNADDIPMRARNHCRPCCWARCSRHLYLEVKDCGSIKLNHPRVRPENMGEMSDTCAQDVAERETGRVGRDPKVLPLEIVGAKLGLTLERARQLEAQALQEVNIRNRREETIR
jgi:hypothetical protein